MRPSVRVQPSIAIMAAVGLLALGLLLTGERCGPTELALGQAQSAARHRLEGEGEHRIGSGTVGPEVRGGAEAETSARRVGGSLIDDESGPLADGRVDLWCEDGRLGSRAQVDADGNFEGPACSGRTCVRLVHPAFEQPEAWVLEPGATRELVVARAPTIAGTVVDELGEPIANANFLLRQGQRRATARSDGDGSFAVSLPRERLCDACDGAQIDACRVGDPSTEASLSLLAWAPELAPRTIELALAPQTSLRVVLSSPAPALTGRVVGPDGAPIGLRTMVLATNREQEAEQHAAAVAADGSFSFADLADTDYRLRAIRDGQALAVLDSAAPGDRAVLRVERALQGRDLRVEVRDDADRPVAGARVDGGPFRGMQTDASGQVEALEVLPGRHTLSVRVAGCPVVRTDVVIDREADTPVHELVRLPMGCVMSGSD